MRIVIDMQGAQSSGSRNRGIGRYTLWLAQAMARNAADHEIILALNGAFTDTLEAIRSDFAGLLPHANIRVWWPATPVFHIDSANAWRRKTAELLREAFLASLKPDFVLISSLFEGLGDDGVTSVARLAGTVPTASILYDLIPLINRRPYLENPAVEAWYENKLDQLRRVDLALAISDSSRDEGRSHLGFSDNDCVSISTATDPRFCPVVLEPEAEDAVRRRYGLNGRFVMYTGGIDHRKNIEGLIRAYSRLPSGLRAQHQLAIVCAVQPHDRERLKALGKSQGLKDHELILTGFVPEDDLIAIYNLCTLFVFPSWHEGFGLPALEAMSCGRAVIGANTSSIPEVIGREDALFDPRSDRAIADKIAQVLDDDVFRGELEQHGLVQARKFSWDISARRAIAAMEKWHEERAKAADMSCRPARRPKLAFVSPLPPERSGISDYSAELLPELSRHYDIEVIAAQASVADAWIVENCPVRSVDWFRQHASRFDRVLYHFGNSAFHQHMFALLEEIPGTVVLHDFFLSGAVAHSELTGAAPGAWMRELYAAHGYAALHHRFCASQVTETMWAYPCNRSVLENARGVIVHAEASRRFARAWYGEQAGEEWAVIPHLRVATHETASGSARESARQALALGADDFVVCSFGLIGPTKLNHRLLDAWLASTLAQDPRCHLVFVGENFVGDYGRQMTESIRASGCADRIRITGWADTETFRRYLSAADIGVQLRTLSRGETSGTVLDCMNYSLPTIVNANGSMADLADDGVWKLPDVFEDDELRLALETLWSDADRRGQLGARARQIILDRHSPRACAALYAEAIERFQREGATDLAALADAIADQAGAPDDDLAWQALAQAIARSLPARYALRQWLIDISAPGSGSDPQSIVSHEMASLLEVTQGWLLAPPAGWRVEPVCFDPELGGYRYARRFALERLACPESLLGVLADDPVDFADGDYLVVPAPAARVTPEQERCHALLRVQGIRTEIIAPDRLASLQPSGELRLETLMHEPAL